MESVFGFNGIHTSSSDAGSSCRSTQNLSNTCKVNNENSMTVLKNIGAIITYDIMRKIFNLGIKKLIRSLKQGQIGTPF
jgi:hypothetical protein